MRPAIVVAALACAAPAFAESAYQLPAIKGHIVDEGGVLKDAYYVERSLDRFRKATSFAIVVFTTKPLGSENIDDVAYKAFNMWKIGEAGKDNGILLVLAPVDRKVRIETGKGIGHVLTDVESADVIAKMKPFLARGEFDQAVDAACTELEAAVLRSGEATAAPKPKRPWQKPWFWALAIPFGLLTIFVSLVRTWPGLRRKLGRVGGWIGEGKTTEEEASSHRLYSSDQSSSSSSSSTSSSSSSSSSTSLPKYTGGGGKSGGGGASDGY